MDENNDLRNRYLLINPPQEWSQEPPTSTPTSTPTTSGSKWLTNNENIVRLVKAIGKSKMSVKEMLEAVGLKNRENFLEFSLNPAIKDKYVKMLYPDKPNHPRQKYRLTVKGLALYSYLEK